LKQKLCEVSLKYGIKSNFQHTGMKELYVQYTKKETLKYNNYRPIKLLNITLKIVAILLNKDLT